MCILLWNNKKGQKKLATVNPCVITHRDRIPDGLVHPLSFQYVQAALERMIYRRQLVQSEIDDICKFQCSSSFTIGNYVIAKKLELLDAIHEIDQQINVHFRYFTTMLPPIREES